MMEKGKRFRRMANSSVDTGKVIDSKFFQLFVTKHLQNCKRKKAPARTWIDFYHEINTSIVENKVYGDQWNGIDGLKIDRPSSTNYQI
ncbi:hypothetical protein TNCV_1423101 [Trichonephila clavipes]|nr:hypothetical protein TNCV_1423101 [Trichonephila clavipes]